MKLGIFVVFAILIVGSIWFAFDRAASQAGVLSAEEKQDAMARILDRAPVLEAKGARTWKTYEGKYLTFSYPEDAKVYKKNPGVSVLESFSAGVTDPRINLTVQVTSGADVSESPAVNLRRADKVYTVEERNIKGNDGVVFTKNVSDGVEKSAFFVKEGKIYSIVVSGYQIEAIEELYGRVIDSIDF